MAKKKTQIKQKQKQSVTINIGNVKRRGRPRKSKPRERRSEGMSIQHTFTAPIINYPPSYVNPAVVQPLQQPESFFVPKPAAAPVPPIVLPEGENLVGAPVTDPVRLQVPTSEASPPILSLLTEKEQQGPSVLQPKREKKLKIRIVPEPAEPVDSNQGMQLELNVNVPEVFKQSNDPAPWEVVKPEPVKPEPEKKRGRPTESAVLKGTKALSKETRVAEGGLPVPSPQTTRRRQQAIKKAFEAVIQEPQTFPVEAAPQRIFPAPEASPFEEEREGTPPDLSRFVSFAGEEDVPTEAPSGLERKRP